MRNHGFKTKMDFLFSSSSPQIKFTQRTAVGSHLPSPRPQFPTCRKSGAERASAAYGQVGTKEKSLRGSMASVLYHLSCRERELGSVTAQYNAFVPLWAAK